MILPQSEMDKLAVMWVELWELQRGSLDDAVTLFSSSIAKNWATGSDLKSSLFCLFQCETEESTAPLRSAFSINVPL